MSTPPSATTPETKGAADASALSAADSAPPEAGGAEAAPHQPAGARRMTRSHAIAVAAVVILVVAGLALPRRSAVVNAPAADSKPEAHDSTAQPIEAVPDAPASQVEPPAAPVAQPEAASPVVGESVKKSPAKPTQKLAAASTRPPIAMPVIETRDKESSGAKRADIGPAATVAAPAPAPPVPETAAVDHVTITGCLEAFGNGDRFRLTDTEGANAPKARSWRTGFLKKRSAAVDLVGGPEVAALHRQIGQRLAVSGVQTDRELRVSSVRVVSASCN
jgi:hypothetical protein